MRFLKRYSFLIFFLVLVYTYFNVKTYINTNKLLSIEKNNKHLDSEQKKEIPRLAIIPSGKGPRFGSDSSKVKMVVFVDYQCKFCEAFFNKQFPILKKKYVDTGIMNIVIKDYPLKFHDDSNFLAKMAHLAYQNGSYQSFIENVWRFQKEKDFAEFSKTYNINHSQPGYDVNDEINTSKFLAGVAGINSTPTIIINDRLLVGLRDIEELNTLIQYSINNSIKDTNVQGSCSD